MNQAPFAFSVDPNGCLTLNLAHPPSWLAGLVIHLPDRIIRYDFASPASPALASSPPFASLIPAFLDHLEIKENAKPHTLTGYRRRLGQFSRWLENYTPPAAGEAGGSPSLSPVAGEGWGGGFFAYYAHLKRRRPAYAPNSLRNHYDALKKFGRWLYERGHLPAPPLADVERPTDKTKSEPRAIERSHINQMLAAAADPRDRALLFFFRDTACRADEAVQLTWSRLKLEEGQVEIIGKGDRARKLFFKPLTRRALEKYRDALPENQRRSDDPVWWGRKGPLNYSGLYKIFQRLAAAAGLGDDIFNPHAWRHAFGRDTTLAGIPTAQLQDLMGHSSIETTKIYAQFNTTELQQAHDRYSPVDGDLHP